MAGSAKQVVLRCLALLQARRVRSAIFPDYLCGIAESGQMTEEALLRTLSWLRARRHGNYGLSGLS
jgi:hypothetical protein